MWHLLAFRRTTVAVDRAWWPSYDESPWAARAHSSIQGRIEALQEHRPKMRREQTVQEVHDFLKKCGAYYLATMESDQPRVRPFGTIHQFDGKLYIQTGKIKAGLQSDDGQSQGGDLRVQRRRMDSSAGDRGRRPRVEAKQSMLDAYPTLQKMYSATDDNTQVLYLKDAVATISSFTHPPRVIEF